MNEGNLVLCTVEKVTNTVTFVRLPNEEEGTIISSEIAPGRIKFMRQYVVPNKKIVCKVLKADNGHIHLSLRRVTGKEKKEVMQQYKQDRAIHAAFNQILDDKSKDIKHKILKDYETLTAFVDATKENKNLIKTYFPKEKEKALLRIIDKRRKSHEMSVHINVTSLEDDGILHIKDLFDLGDSHIRVTYLSAGEFRLKLVVDDFKQGKKDLQDLLTNLEKKAKKTHLEFHAKEER